jgi:phosphoglycolate phosphatase-like HAD superfamily hydrolase
MAALWKSPYDLYLFDNDGTLVKSVHELIDIDCGIIGELTGNKPSRYECHRIMKLSKGFDKFWNHFGIEDHVRAEQMYYEREQLLNYEATAGAFDILMFFHLNQTKKHMVTFTDSIDSVTHKLKTAGLIHFFKNDQIALTDGHKTETIVALCEQYEVKPRNTLLLTDSANDVRAAKAAGVDSLVLLNPETSYNTIEELLMAKPTHSVYTLESAKVLLERM